MVDARAKCLRMQRPFEMHKMSPRMGGVMLVEIKDVKQCRNKAYGNFLLRGRESALITISLKKNQTVAEYGSTILHELLHLWVTILRKKTFKCRDSKEHRFIYAVEDAIYTKAKNI